MLYTYEELKASLNSDGPFHLSVANFKTLMDEIDRLECVNADNIITIQMLEERHDSNMSKIGELTETIHKMNESFDVKEKQYASDFNHLQTLLDRRKAELKETETQKEDIAHLKDIIHAQELSIARYEGRFIQLETEYEKANPIVPVNREQLRSNNAAYTNQAMPWKAWWNI